MGACSQQRRHRLRRILRASWILLPLALALGLVSIGFAPRLARTPARGVRAADPGGPDPGTLQLGAAILDLEARRVLRAGEEVHLRPKEYELLAALAARRGQAISRDELLVKVWGYEASVASRTVDWHVAELRKKLEADPSKPALIHTVRGFGYRLDRNRPD